MNNKLLIGIGLVAIGGYLLYRDSKKSFVTKQWYSNPNIIGRRINIINR